MAQKIICDVCGKETPRNYARDRFQPQLAPNGADAKGIAKPPIVRLEVHASVQTGAGYAWNQGDLCLECLKKTIAAGEPPASLAAGCC